MILEGIVTTTHTDGRVNVAPMGARADQNPARWFLRPFQSSATFENLRRRRTAVFHVTDDVLLIARATLDRWPTPPPLVRVASIDEWALADTCRWYALRVDQIDAQEPRAECVCQVVESARVRDFVGFNRAMWAVVEAAILASRAAILPPDRLREGLAALEPVVDKTAGAREREAFVLLRDYIHTQLARPATVL